MSEEHIEISEKLEKIVTFAIDEATEKLAQGEELVPFVVIAKGEDLYIESFPEGEVADCFNMARAEIAREATETDCYVLCYDGYVEGDDGEVDAIVAECAEKGDATGHAIGRMYDADGEFEADDDLVYLGEIPSLLAV